MPDDDTSDLPEEPRRIGPYKILRPLGEGGMGVVYEAEQTEPVHRRVALKIIKLGMDTRQVVARFEAERQALAVMDHPNIARVFDAGTTDAGRPYFAMELVKGTPLDEYCDTHKLPTEERLELFIQVCAAVQHAHQKGVIHRDLKPSNVLVTIQDETPVPKVIDFGIAKAVGHELTEKTLVTQLGQLMGTPRYMSPEQAEMSGLDVDTRTDIYSLGIMLYELLVGAAPFDFGDIGFVAIKELIRELDPPTPSSRLTTLGGDLQETLARYRATDPVTLKRELKGDLDWVVMKCLEKDRTRRYDTAHGLATELQRYLRAEPVIARPASVAYRVQKFVRRNRAVVGGAAALAAALIAGTVGTAIGLVRARDAEQQARDEAEVAEQVSAFLVGLFAVNDPSEARGNTITAREILDRGAERVEEELADQPMVLGRLMHTMGGVYRTLGLYEDAKSLLERALELRRGALGENHPDVAETLVDLARVYQRQGRPGEAIPLLQSSIALREEAFGTDDPYVGSMMQELGVLLRDQGQYDSARTVLGRALVNREAYFGPDHINTAGNLYHLGWLLHLMGEYEGSLATYQRVQPIFERELGTDNSRVAWVYNDLAIAHRFVGQRDSALSYYQRSLEIRERILPPDHPDIAASLNNLGSYEYAVGNLEEAEAYYRRALEMRERALEPGHPDIAGAISNLGLTVQGQGRFGEARALHERALDILERAWGPGHPDLMQPLGNLGFLLRYIDEPAAARPLLERALSIGENALGVDHPELRPTLTNLGFLHRDIGDYETGSGYLQRAVTLEEKTFGRDSPELIESLGYLAGSLIAGGRLAEARPFLERARSLAETHRGAAPWVILFDLGTVYLDAGDDAPADSLFQLALDIYVDSAAVIRTYREAGYRATRGDSSRALELLREAVRLGYDDPWIARDYHLKPLSGDPGFEALVDEVMRRNGLDR
jgi:non-specific serine/threonine protein kinase/serine/threonine-protein kinase